MSPQSPGTLAALLGPDLKVSLQMRWAAHLAAARKRDLLILHRVEGNEDRVQEVSLDEPPKGEATAAIHEVQRVIEESPGLRAGPRGGEAGDDAEVESGEHTVHVSMKLLYFSSIGSLRSAVLAEVERGKVKLFTLARRQLVDMSDVDLVRERRTLLRHIPCELVLCHGLEIRRDLSRVLVATATGPNGRAALRLGQDLAASVDGEVTALHVSPKVGLDDARVGERRLDRFLKRAAGTDCPTVNRRVVVDNQVHRGIRRVWEEDNHDVIVTGAPRDRLEGSLGTKLGKGVPVIFVSAASPFRNRFRSFVEKSIRRFVPQIARDDRIALVDRLQSSAAWNFDFFALILLSTFMAAIGLMQNSGAVVIGAMLVAPLMTPIMGLGLAIELGNPVLARLSVRSIVLGVLVALFGGFLVGFFTPSLEEPTREMLSRGGPGLLDLLVAFAAGLAAAYASSRPSLLAALPGVAIAAALVPPIATSGLALSLGDFPLALGALLLFGINMVTIVLASLVSLWAVGFRNIGRTSTLTVAAGTAVLVAVLGLGVYLSISSSETELVEEIPEGLMEAVQESLGEDHHLENLAVAYDELGVQLNLQVSSEIPISEALATEVRTVASDHYAQPVRVRLLTQIEIER